MQTFIASHHRFRETGFLSRKKRKVLTLSGLICFQMIFTGSGFAQGSKGVLSGTIVDKESGNSLIGADVLIIGTTLGAATDLQGNYRIAAVLPGQYTLRASYIGYEPVEITDVIVKAGEVTRLDFSMGMQVLEGEEVVVTAKAIRNTEAVLLKDRQKSAAVSDAISAEAISQAGSGNAAEAMKQITGASVVGGRYVYVRGLGDRYTSTQLNGVEIPSTNPYRRAGSIDLIPTNMVDNIVTLKSFTPDKQGNFSGGTVDIKTRDFPDLLDIQVSSSLSYNSNTTFNSNGPIGYSGGGMDWLGMDDGTRAVPEIVEKNGIPYIQYDRDNLDSLSAATRSFNPQMWVKKVTPPMNQNYSFSIGNQMHVLGRPLGFIGSLSYSRSVSSCTNGEYNAWNLIDSTASSLDELYSFNLSNTTDEVLWGGLVKTSLKLNPTNIVSANIIFNQNGESSANYYEGQYDYDKLDNIDDLHQNHVLGYSQRRLTSFQFNGEHQLESLLGTRIEWKAATSKTSQDEPDLRYFTSYVKVDELADGTIKETPGVFSNIVPQRFWRYLDESSQEYSIDVTMPFLQWSGKLSRFKFGGFYSAKNRQFEELSYKYSDYGKYNGNPEDYFSTQNMGWDSTTQTINGVEWTSYYARLYITEGDIGANNYTGDMNITAFYGMIDMPLMRSLRFIGGARFEKTDMELISADATKENGAINTRDVLPSLNLIYSIRDNMNLRGSVTQTLALPTMREMAPYASYDFALGFTYIGNPALKRTLIDNYDIRWEWFSRPGEIYAVSAFYKNFHNPIERAFIIEAKNREITWINVDKSLVMGVEFEVRKRLDILSSKLSDFLIGSNLSLVHSEVTIPADELSLMRIKNPDIKSTRELEGQSPYLLNVNLNYDNIDRGFHASLYYNIFGERLSEVNKSGLPYVYEQSVGTLNATFGLLISPQLKLNFGGKNLLNSVFQKTHEYKDVKYVFRKYTTGRTFSLGLNYSL